MFAVRAARHLTSFATGSADDVILALFALFRVGSCIVNVNIFHPRVFTGLPFSAFVGIIGRVRRIWSHNGVLTADSGAILVCKSGILTATCTSRVLTATRVTGLDHDDVAVSHATESDTDYWSRFSPCTVQDRYAHSNQTSGFVHSSAKRSLTMASFPLVSASSWCAHNNKRNDE